MANNRAVEVTVTAIFIGSIVLYMFLGLQHFAGFKYASTINRFILIVLAINIHLGLLYYAYRFIKWAVEMPWSKNKWKNKGKNKRDGSIF